MTLRRISAVLALTSLVRPAEISAQVVRERVSVDVVTVSLTARDGRGRPVRDLSSSELSLSVDGKPVAIDTFAPVASRQELARDPEAAQPVSADPTRPAALPTPRRPHQIVLFLDEGETHPFDRRDVYDELISFVRTPGAGERSFFVVSFSGWRLVTNCPWTSDTATVAEAIRRLRARPRSERIPTPADLAGTPEIGGTPAVVLEVYRHRLNAALLEAIAAFPEDPGQRQLIVVSGGAALAREADIASELTYGTSGSSRDTSASTQELERGRDAFMLWSRAVAPSRRGLAMTDVIAKALERDVAFVPIAAEAMDRIADASSVNVRNKSLSPRPPVVGERRLSPRLAVAEAMMGIAEDTGGEPILAPRKTAARLEEIEARAAYAISFRNPSSGDLQRHTIQIACRRTGVRLDYRRGYRVPTDEERTLDTVVARFLQPGRGSDPLAVAASLSAAGVDGRRVTRLALRYEPPRESRQEDERPIEIVAVGESAGGERTEPIRWSNSARRADGETGFYEATMDLGVAPGKYRWSFAVRDVPTGLTAFVLAEP